MPFLWFYLPVIIAGGMMQLARNEIDAQRDARADEAEPDPMTFARRPTSR